MSLFNVRNVLYLLDLKVVLKRFISEPRMQTILRLFSSRY